ncbi:MAG TPA: hypothetical protein EYQ84_08480 [Nitrospinaceae bacterium]|nr:hypothetical protein [Nitrospinaceae bacterium]
MHITPFLQDRIADKGTAPLTSKTLSEIVLEGRADSSLLSYINATWPGEDDVIDSATLSASLDTIESMDVPTGLNLEQYARVVALWAKGEHNRAMQEHVDSWPTIRLTLFKLGSINLRVLATVFFRTLGG